MAVPHLGHKVFTGPAAGVMGVFGGNVVVTSDNMWRQANERAEHADALQSAMWCYIRATATTISELVRLIFMRVSAAKYSLACRTGR